MDKISDRISFQNTSTKVANIAKAKKSRESNFELLRIMAMLAIIAHHFVVNSGVTQLFDYSNPNTMQYFLEVWGMWGKTAINSFILISGYFLCRQRLTWQRYAKLFAQIYFYAITIMLLFAITEYEPLTLTRVIKRLLTPFMLIGNEFTASFMAFYAFVPVYNKLINALTKIEHRRFVLGLLFITTICGTFFGAHNFLEPLWYATLYFIAAYVRLYPNSYFDSLKLTSVLLMTFVAMAVLSVVVIQWVGGQYVPMNAEKVYWFVSDSHKILAFIVGFTAFLVAKNIPSFHSKVINWISAGTFGVLLIHSSSATMRRWLWQDVFQVPGLFMGRAWNSTIDGWQVVLISVFAPFVIFMICTSIDWLRREFLERPFMNRLLQRWPEI